MSAKKNLTFLMKIHQYNANSLAEASDGILAQPTTRRILLEESLSLRDNTLIKYANFFKVELCDLKFGDLENGVKFSTQQSQQITDSLTTKLDSTIIDLPILREVFEENSQINKIILDTQKTITFKVKILEKYGIDPYQYIAAINPTDEMQTTIKVGSEMIIDAHKKEIKDGKIYALEHGGMLRIRRLYRQPFGAVKMVVDNHSYANEILTKEQWRNECKIIGWVFYWSTIDTW